jgi:hypothetical protein
MTNQNDDDPIVAEVHQAREALLARFDNDLSALVKHLQQRTAEDAQAGHPTIDLPPRRPVNWSDTKKAG